MVRKRALACPSALAPSLAWSVASSPPSPTVSHPWWVSTTARAISPVRNPLATIELQLILHNLPGAPLLGWLSLAAPRSFLCPQSWATAHWAHHSCPAVAFDLPTYQTASSLGAGTTFNYFYLFNFLFSHSVWNTSRC